MIRKAHWSLIIFAMVIALSNFVMAAPQPGAAGYGVELKGLTGTWQYGIAKNLVYWNTKGLAYGPGDSAYATRATDDTLDNVIPSRYVWNSSEDEITGNGTHFTRSTRNRINALGDGRYVIEAHQFHAVPVICVDLLHQTDDAHLYGMTVTVFGNEHFNPYEDLRPISNNNVSGLQLYQDVDWQTIGDATPERLDNQDHRLGIKMDSTTKHFNDINSKINGAAASAMPGQVLTSTSDVDVVKYRTWIPTGYHDNYLGYYRPTSDLSDNDWYGWQVYFELDHPLDVHDYTDNSILNFVRLWIATRPAKCCDNPDGPMDADSVSWYYSETSDGDEFFFALLPDLGYNGGGANWSDGSDFPVYRVIDAHSYNDAAGWNDMNTNPRRLISPRKSMLLAPRQTGVSGLASLKPGSEASWQGRSDTTAQPALWDVPGVIHGWGGQIGPVAKVIEPAVLESYRSGNQGNTSVMQNDSGAYYAAQKNIYSDSYPYTSDSLQVVVFEITDDDNCLDYDSVYITVDTGGSTPDTLGIDSVIYYNELLSFRTQPGQILELERDGQSAVAGDAYPWTYNDARTASLFGMTRAWTANTVHPKTAARRCAGDAKTANEVSYNGVTLIRDTAKCVDSLIFNIAFMDTAVGQATTQAFGGWKDGQIVKVTLYAKDRGGNPLYYNYNKTDPAIGLIDEDGNSAISNNTNGTGDNHLTTRFAVDLSAPIAEIVCPEYIDRPTNTTRPIRVTRVQGANYPIVKILVKDAFLADSTSENAAIRNANGAHKASGTEDVVYLHDYVGKHGNIGTTPAPGTGFDPNNMAILVTRFQCGGATPFDPQNYGWNANASGAARWTADVGQVLISDTGSFAGITVKQDASVAQNDTLILDTNFFKYHFCDQGTNQTAAAKGTGTIDDGDVFLIEVIDANLAGNNAAAAPQATLIEGKDHDGNSTINAADLNAQNVYSDGLHDSPQILWSPFTVNDNLPTTEANAFAGFPALNGNDMKDCFSWNDTERNAATYNDLTGSAVGVDHELYNAANDYTDVLTQKFKFRQGNTQGNYPWAVANPNKHLVRDDETDCNNTGTHGAPEYTVRGVQYATRTTTITTATDTLGWFYVDKVGPIVDLASVYPFMRRTSDWDATVDAADRFDNREYLFSYTSDPYQVITFDLADLSCNTYADSFAAGMDVSTIVMNVKVFSCDGSYHPAYGPEGRNFTPVNGTSASNDSTPCFYIDDPTDINTNTHAIIEGITGNSNLRAISPATRVIFDPRLAPKNTSNLLESFPTDEPIYRFRDGDKVCVTVYARDVANGGCNDVIGNEIENDDYAVDKVTLADANLFKYNFVVDTKEPTLTFREQISTFACAEDSIRVRISDFCRDCNQGAVCSTWSAGSDSIFVEIKHWDFVEAGDSLAGTPSIYRLAMDYTDAAMNNQTYYNGTGATFDYLADSIGGAYNTYTPSAGANNNVIQWDLKIRWDDCGIFRDGDSVYVKVWGRDQIDNPWYPVDKDITHYSYVYDDADVIAEIDHHAQDSSGIYRLFKWYKHPNMWPDSSIVPSRSTEAGDTLTTWDYFANENPSWAANKWWTSWDWKPGKSTDGTSQTDNNNNDQLYAFENIHWNWVAPWALDNILAYWPGKPTANYSYSELVALGIDTTRRTETSATAATVTMNNNAWKNDTYSGVDSLDDDGRWFDAGEANQFDQHDYDWTDLDSIPVNSNVHHNWAKPIETSFKVARSARIVTVEDTSPGLCTISNTWSWNGGTVDDTVAAARGINGNADSIYMYRYGLSNEIEVIFQTCDDFYYCNSSPDTTVGFAMECYDSLGKIKWYWPFKNEDARYINDGRRKEWDSVFNVDKVAAATAASYDTTKLHVPVQYGWWDCDCKGCNGVFWTTTNPAGNCNSTTGTLTVDLDQLQTYRLDSTYIYLSNQSNSYTDGDSVVCYTYTRTTSNPNMADSNDHIIRRSWYYLIDKKAPTFNFADLEIYVPELPGDSASALELKGEINQKVEAKYGDVIRLKIKNAMDDVTGRKIANGDHAVRSVGIRNHVWYITNNGNGARFGISAQNITVGGSVPVKTNRATSLLNMGGAVTGGYISNKDDSLATLDGTDTVFFDAVQVTDQREVYIPEYKTRIWFKLRDRLCNVDSMSYDVVVDNVRPKVVYDYCGDSINWVYTADSSLGYWLNGEDSIYYNNEFDDYADSLGIVLYQNAEDPNARWNEAEDSVVELAVHKRGQDRTAIAQLCRGQLYVRINFNDLMFTGKDAGTQFTSAPQVRIKPEKGSPRDVNPVDDDDIGRLVQALQYFDTSPPAKKVKADAKSDHEEGWFGETTWLGQVYIGSGSEWDGDAVIMVTGFYDKAGNEMIADTACFKVNFTTTNGVITSVHPNENDTIPDQCYDTVYNPTDLVATLKNLAAIDTMRWHYTVTKETYGDTVVHSEMAITSGVNTVVDSFSRSTKPDSNGVSPWISSLGGDIETTYVYWKADEAVPATFSTRKDVQLRAVIRGQSSCVDSMSQYMNVEIDYENPYIALLESKDVARDSNANYEVVTLSASYYDDPSFYNEPLDSAHMAAAKAEITACEWQVWDVTANEVDTTWVTVTAASCNVDSITPANAMMLTFVPDSVGINKLDSMEFRLIVTDNACNKDTSNFAPVEQLVRLPIKLARGNSLDEAVKSIKVACDTVERSFWPHYFYFDTITDGQNRFVGDDSKVYTLDSMQITTFNHYNPEDSDPDVSDPFGDAFTSNVREYPGDLIYIVVDSTADLYLSASAGDSMFIYVEGASSADGSYQTGNKLFPNGENPERRLTATYDATCKYWYAQWIIEDEAVDQDGIVRIKAVGKKADSTSESTKYVDYGWIILDTEDPTYTAEYTTSDKTPLPKAKTVNAVTNDETIGQTTKIKTLAEAGEYVWVTNAQNINAYITVDQTVSTWSSDGRIILDGKGRMWSHVNVDFEAPTAYNTRSSDESFATVYYDSSWSQDLIPYRNWITKDHNKTFKFNTQVKNGGSAQSGFAWVKVETRDVAGNYVRDWSTDNCEDLVVYIDTEAPSAPDSNKMGAMPMGESSSIAAAEGIGGVSAKALKAQGYTYRVFGQANAAVDDSWPAELTMESNTLPTVKVYDESMTLLTSTQVKSNGSYTVEVTLASELAQGAPFYVSVVDYAGNESAKTKVVLSEPITVEIPLEGGWNLFSSNANGGDFVEIMSQDYNSSVVSAFQYIYTQPRDGAPISLEKDELDSYIANGTTSGIDIGSTEALSYWIYVKYPVTLTVKGMPVDPEVAISLAEGWNYVAYLPENPAKITEAIVAGLDDISAIATIDDISYITDGTPSKDLMLYPGKGYLVKTDAATATMQYSATAGLGSGLAKSAKKSNTITSIARSPKEYITANFDAMVSTKGFMYERPCLFEDVIQALNDKGEVIGEAIADKDGVFDMMFYQAQVGNFKKEITERNVEFTINGEKASFIVDGKELTTFSGDWSIFNNAKLVVELETPATTELVGNYPNPFNPSTSISYNIANKEKVELAVYNVLGQKVKTLVKGYKKAGSYKATWDGKNEFGDVVGSGIYFVRFKAGKISEALKMQMIK